MSTELAKRDQIVPANERDLFRAVAEDVAKEVAHHIKVMYPDAVKACPSTFLLSVRGTVINSIMAWFDVAGPETAKRIEFHDKFRKYIERQYRKIRRAA